MITFTIGAKKNKILNNNTMIRNTIKIQLITNKLWVKEQQLKQTMRQLGYQEDTWDPSSEIKQIETTKS